MIIKQQTLTMKVINNLKLSQWIYTSFESVYDKNKFHKSIFNGIIALLIGLFNGSIAYTEQLLFHNYGCDALRYVICRSKISFSDLCESYNKWIIKLSLQLSDKLNKEIALVIDDTLVKKDSRSKCLAVGGKKKNIVGFSLLTSVLVIGKISLPLVPQLCFRRSACEKWGVNYVPKTTRAMQTIKRLIESGLDSKKLILIMDSWYSSNEIINYCQSIPDLKYVFGIKSNRHIDKRPVDKLKHGFRYIKSHRLSNKEHNFYLSLRPGKLNGVRDRVNILLSRRETKKSNITNFHFGVGYDFVNLDNILLGQLRFDIGNVKWTPSSNNSTSSEISRITMSMGCV